MVAWFLGLEDVLSWLLVAGNYDVIAMVRNAISLFKLEIDNHFVELTVVEKLLEADIVGNEKMLYKIVNVVEKDNIVEQLVITVVDTEYDCTEVDGCFDMKVCEDS
ncbi:hypothetical protein Tco_1184218 [Tanacetum coccineum]